MAENLSSKWRTAAVILVALTAAACQPSGAAPTTSEPEVTTTTAASTTTTGPAPTTTTPASTTTTLQPTTTTTTEPADLTVELTDEGIHVGAMWFPFGSDDDDVVSALTTALGPPLNDSGWLDSNTDGWNLFGVCPAPRVRGVNWGETGASFQVLFTDGDTDFWIGGVEHFFTFYYLATSAPTDLTTPEGIGVGSTLGDLKAAYDPSKIVIDEAWFDPAEGFWSYDQEAWTGLWGFATGQGDGDVITSLNGGLGCGE